MKNCESCYFFEVCDRRVPCKDYYPVDDTEYVPPNELREEEFRDSWLAYWIDRWTDGLLGLPDDE